MNTLLYVKIHSFIDVITNSSTELFVGKNNTKSALIEMIENIHPSYRNEYHPLKSMDELSNDEIHIFLSYSYDRWSNRDQEMVHDVVDGFEFDEMYEQWEWDGKKTDNFYIRDDFVTVHRDRIIESLDPNREYFFLFSYDQNPNWDEQEKLMTIMSRYHLG